MKLGRCSLLTDRRKDKHFSSSEAPQQEVHAPPQCPHLPLLHVPRVLKGSGANIEAFQKEFSRVWELGNTGHILDNVGGMLFKLIMIINTIMTIMSIAIIIAVYISIHVLVLRQFERN